jgi:PKD repeat protein
VTVRNNIWQNCVYGPGFQSVQVQDHNMLNTGGASFVNAAAGNFHLASNTTAGANLGSPYNVDPDGNTRKTWSLGAYEYGSISTNLAPPAPSGLLGVVLSTTNYASLTIQALWSASWASSLHLNFGDGSYADFGNNNAVSTNHTYASPGTYTVTLTASNNVSARSVSGSQVITVTQ